MCFVISIVNKSKFYFAYVYTFYILIYKCLLCDFSDFNSLFGSFWFYILLTQYFNLSLIICISLGFYTNYHTFIAVNFIN